MNNYLIMKKITLLVLLIIGSVTVQADSFVPWRKVSILNNSKTEIFIEGNERKQYKIADSAKDYFLDEEKGGSVVNVCKAIQTSSNLLLRCDRKGGFRDSAKPRAWWWNYKARIERNKVIIFSVSQKDGEFESGEAIENHFID